MIASVVCGGNRPVSLIAVNACEFFYRRIAPMPRDLVKVFASSELVLQLCSPRVRLNGIASLSCKIDAEIFIKVGVVTSALVVEVMEKKSNVELAPARLQMCERGEKFKKCNAVFAAGEKQMNVAMVVCEDSIVA